MNDDRELELINIARRQAAKVRSWSGASSPLLNESPAIRAKGALPNYEILREIHRGGQGVVYLARQRSTDRQVAIKVMREGPFAGRADQFRFEREVQILAGLKHPNIVTIHDSGSSAGQFHYVMEYIEGQPLDEYARTARLTAQQALALVAQICDAVNAAHLRGIIHRDLKPGNIRVDRDGKPHVLDFGLAKDSADSTNTDTVTHNGQFIGSLPWASPEQAEGRHADVDVRTDVYSLGVLLYQLLAGRFPYDVHGPMREVMNAIVTVEPRPPSAFLPTLEPDVDTILLKCLNKSADRRYQNAGELAADIRRYLAGEAIDAKRDHTLYVIGKMIRRHRLPVGLAAGVLLLVVASAVALSVMYKKQKTLREEAERQTTQAQLERERAEKFAADARTKLELASDTAAFMLEQVSTTLGSVLGAGPLKNEILQKTYEKFDALSKEQGDDPALRLKLAQTRRYLGLIATDLGRTEDAERHAAAAKDLFTAILTDSPESVDALVGLSGSCTLLGTNALRRAEYALAEAEYMLGLTAAEKAMAVMPDHPDVLGRYSNVCGVLSTLARTRKQPEATATWLAKACAVKKALMERFPENTKYLREYGLCEYYMARDEFEAGRAEAAREHFDRAIEFNETLLAREPSQSGVVENLGLCYYQLSLMEEKAGRAAEGYEWIRKAVEMNRRRLNAEPSNLNYKYMFAINRSKQGVLAFTLERMEESIDAHMDAVATYRQLIAADPGSRSYQSNFAYCLGQLGRALKKAGRQDEAIRAYAEGVENGEALVSAGEWHEPDVLWLAWNSSGLGGIHRTSGKYAEARPHFERAIALLEDASQRRGPSEDAAYAERLSESYSKLAEVARKLNDDSAAVKAEEMSRAWRAKLPALTATSQPETTPR